MSHSGGNNNFDMNRKAQPLTVSDKIKLTAVLVAVILGFAAFLVMLDML